MSTIMISDVMERHILSFCSEYVGVVVRKLATKYNFDAEEAISELELPTMKRSDVAPRRKEATEKPKKELRTVPTIPLPFCGVMNDDWCHAIAKNHKLFTQCTNKKEEQNELCKKCTKSGAQFGNMETRMACGPMEFKDPKGTSPVNYAIVMKKLNITRETAEAEASKFEWTIDESQYVMPEKARGRPKKSDDENSDDAEKKAGKRGRPKKDKPVKASSQMCDDVIANLLEEANKEAVAEANNKSSEEEEEEDASSSQPDESQTQTQEEAPKPKKVVKKTDKAAKEAEKAAKEAAKEAEKAAKEAAKEAEKAAKAAEKALAKDAKATTTTKTTEKSAKTKTAAPATKKVEIKQVETVETEELEEEAVDEEEEEEVQAFKVKKFLINGKKYKISTDNILYGWEDDETVGVWNPKTKKIEALPKDDEEEEDDDE